MTASKPPDEGWVRVEERLPDRNRLLLITNNINARDAHGEMSHVWLVPRIYPDEDWTGCYSYDGNIPIHSISHWRYALPEAK